MFDCTPPPAPLAAAVREATRVASHYIAPLDVPKVCMTILPDGIAGQATDGVVWFDRADATFTRPVRQWHRHQRVLVMHEVLHQYVMPHWYAGTMDEWDRETEEGVVSAVALDLTPHLELNMGVYTKRVSMGIWYIPPGYEVYTSRVYAHGWTGARGREWRAELIQASPAVRKEMVNTVG